MDKRQLASRIWESANTMRSKIEAQEYNDYILGFIFYKYLSEKAISFANELLKDEGLAEKYYQLDENNPDHAELIDGIKEGKADAVLAASIFHFGEVSIRDAKLAMREAGIEVRL